MKPKKWETLKSQIIAKDKYLEIRDETVRFSNGRVINNYKQIKSPDIVIVFALTKDHKVVMIKEYKHGARRVMLTLPAGLLLDNNTAEELAYKELREETGYQTDRLIRLATLREYPTKMQHKVHIFLAPEASKIGEQKLEPNENIEVKLVPINELKKLILSGKIESAAIVSTIFLGMQKLRNAQ